MNSTAKRDGRIQGAPGSRLAAWAKGTAALLAIVAMGLTTGCSQDNPTVDRVQPDFVKKSWLDGEWYFRVTVADAPSLSGNTFPGNQSMLERGVFEVQEDMVHFYRTYEWAPNSEVIGQAADTDKPLLDENGNVVMRETVINGETVDVPVYIYRGAPVASFPIMGHFDLRRDFNTVTGETINTVIEDTRRSWYDRQFIHVDFANVETGNLDFPVSAPMSGTGVISYTAISPKSGGDSDEAPVWEFENVGTDDERLMYFDQTTRGIFGIPTEFLSGFGEVPMCWFFPWFAGGVFECQSEEIQLRMAFKRYESNGYQAWNFDDERLNEFGYYRAERPTYDVDRGISYSGISRQITRFNIWENWVDSTDGSPDYSQMTPKPIVYYQSEDTPRELVVPNVELMLEWTEPFDETVEFLKGESPGHSMVILCENNLVEACSAFKANMPTAIFATPGEEAAACAQVGIVVENSSGADAQAIADASFCHVDASPKRIGDLRYNLLASINRHMNYPLLGYGPPSYDPLTGEIVTANAYSYVGVMLPRAQRTLDTIEMMGGIRTFLEIENRSHIIHEQYNKRLKKNGSGGTSYNPMTIQNAAATLVDPSISAGLQATGLQEYPNFAKVQLSKIEQRPDLETHLIGDDFRHYTKDPTLFQGQDMTPELMKHVSPRGWATADAHHRQELDDHNHAMRTEFMSSFADNAILNLVREYQRVYDSAFCSELNGKHPEIFDWTEFATVGDECSQLGATNEDGWVCRAVSGAKLNDSQSQLRWVNECTSQKLVDQMRVRYEVIEGTDPFSAYDPGSPAYENTGRDELDAAITEFRSILDDLREQHLVEIWQIMYKGTQTHEVGHNLGLRHNFEASTDALNFGEEYWNLKMEMGADGVYRPVVLWQTETEDQAYQGMREWESTSVMEYTRKFNGRRLGLGLYDKAVIRYGYGRVLEVFNNTPDMDELSKFTAEPQSNGADQLVLGTSDSTLEDALHKVHHTNYLRYFDNSIDNVYDRKLVREDELSDSDVKVPYRFCSDEYAGYTPTCQRHDEGVDPFEIVIRHGENYENYWPLAGYSHDSLTFDATGYGRGVQRYFYEMRKQFQYWVQLRLHYNANDWWANNIGDGVPWDLDINGGLTYTMAVKESFNIMANALGRPSEGRYGLNTNTGKYEPIYGLGDDQYTNQRWILQDDGARPFYEAFDFQGYLYTPLRSGAIYDRIYAMTALADPSMFPFLNADLQADPTRFMVNYYTVFPREMIRLMGSIMNADESEFGWWVCDNYDSTERRDFFSDEVPEGCERALNPEPRSAFPNAKYRIPALASLYGMALMTGNYDQSFLHASRLCLEGSGECADFPSGVDVARFEDPLSGKVYKAARYGAGADYDVAYETVRQAEEEFGKFLDPDDGSLDVELLQDNFYFSELQFTIGKLELIRSMYGLYSESD